MPSSNRRRSELERSYLEPPDGGFGWVVTLGVFIVFFIIGGNAYSFGVLYVEFLDAFGASKASTAWIGSLYMSTGIIGYPLSMALITKYNHRTVMMIGGILSSGGMIATSFATSIGQIYVVYGIFTSTCHWLLSVPSLSMLRMYFKKRLALVLGLGLAGTGAGQFVLSFLSQVLINEYGWRGTLLIISAINLHICVAGALYRPIEIYNIINRRRCRNNVNNEACDSRDENDGEKTNDGESWQMSNQDRKLDSDGNSDLDLEKAHASEQIQLQSEAPHNDQVQENQNSIPERCRTCSSKLCGFLNSAFDWSLFKNLAFLLMIETAFGSQAGNFASLSHIVKRGRDYGISSLLSSSLPAITGLAQFLGRIFWGVVGGVSTKIKPVILYGGSIGTAGIASIISIYIPTYAGQLVYVIILGVSMACFIPTFPVVLHDLLDSSQVDHGVMFYLQAQTIGATLVTPLAGWMRDIDGDYDSAFYVIGLLYIVSAICALLAPVADKYVVKRNRNHKECVNADNKDEPQDKRE